MAFTNDPIADFERWDAEQEAWLAKRPVCADCDEHIQDCEAYYINGCLICQNCIEAYRIEVGDFCE